MRFVGTFYLSSGQTHKETFRVKKNMHSAVKVIDYMTDNFNKKDCIFTFGKFHVNTTNLVGMKFKSFYI